MILTNMLKSFLSRSLSHKQVISHNGKVIQPWMLSNPSSTLPGWVRNDCRSKSKAENEEKPPFLGHLQVLHLKGRNPVDGGFVARLVPPCHHVPRNVELSDVYLGAILLLLGLHLLSAASCLDFLTRILVKRIKTDLSSWFIRKSCGSPAHIVLLCMPWPLQLRFMSIESWSFVDSPLFATSLMHS